MDDSPTEGEEECATDTEDDYSDKQKKDILKFLNTSSEDELCDVPGCSITKANLLAKHLPFDQWEDLVIKVGIYFRISQLTGGNR